MFDRRRSRQQAATRKMFSTCAECGLTYDRETDHACPEPIAPDDTQVLMGLRSARCVCGQWCDAMTNRCRTVTWYCPHCRTTHHSTLRRAGETDPGPSHYRPPPLPPATPGSARWGAGVAARVLPDGSVADSNGNSRGG